jgi:hypothetical protein
MVSNRLVLWCCRSRCPVAAAEIEAKTSRANYQKGVIRAAVTMLVFDVLWLTWLFGVHACTQVSLVAV